MDISYVYAVNGEKKIDINLSRKNIFKYEEKTNNLKISNNDKYIDGFFGSNIRDITAIVGSNGAGKSTYLRHIKYLLEHIYNNKTISYNEKYLLIFTADDNDYYYYYTNIVVSPEIENLGVDNFHIEKKEIYSNKLFDSFHFFYYSNVFDNSDYEFNENNEFDISTKYLVNSNKENYNSIEIQKQIKFSLKYRKEVSSFFNLPDKITIDFNGSKINGDKFSIFKERIQKDISVLNIAITEGNDDIAVLAKEKNFLINNFKKENKIRKAETGEQEETKLSKEDKKLLEKKIEHYFNKSNYMYSGYYRNRSYHKFISVENYNDLDNDLKKLIELKEKKEYEEFYLNQIEQYISEYVLRKENHIKFNDEIDAFFFNAYIYSIIGNLVLVDTNNEDFLFKLKTEEYKDILEILEMVSLDFHLNQDTQYNFLKNLYESIQIHLNELQDGLEDEGEYNSKNLYDLINKSLIESIRESININDYLSQGFMNDIKDPLDTSELEKISLNVICELIYSYFEKKIKKISNYHQTIVEEIDSCLILNDSLTSIIISVDTISLEKKLDILHSELYPNLFKYYWDTMSSGQYAFLDLFSRFPINISEKSIFIMIDEGELYFHPQWQLKYIYLLTNFARKIFKESRVTFLLTTHSPLVLSDIPRENSYVLGDSSNFDEIKDETFAANIINILTNEFFIQDGLVGTFAKNKINCLFEELISLGEISVQEYKNYLKIINMVGEPLLKNNLNRILNEKFVYRGARDSELIELKQFLKTKLEEIENFGEEGN